MGYKRLLSANPTRTEIFHFDDETDKVTIESRYDVDPTLKSARLHRDAGGEDGHGDLRHVAEVPQDILDKSLREAWDSKDWKAWANNPDNRKFRVWGGRM